MLGRHIDPLGEIHQHLIYRRLRYRVLRPALAHVDALGIPPGHIDDGRADQPVIEHHIGTLQESQRLEGHQVRITRPGTDQVEQHPVTRQTEQFGCFAIIDGPDTAGAPSHSGSRQVRLLAKTPGLDHGITVAACTPGPL